MAGHVTASATWTDGDRFIGTASSGHAIVVDSGPEKTGNGPMELVLIGLCSCTATDVVNILRKKREPFTSVEVRAHGQRAAEPPTLYTSIKVVYRVGGAINRKSVEDAVRLSMEKYCSVEAMLKKSANITFEIVLD
jgi:putative redox protein